MRVRIIPAVVLLLVLVSALASADDTLVTLAAGGLVPLKTTHISMESEDLHISIHRIKVRYVFHNASANDIHAIVTFPLPDLAGDSLYVEPTALPNENSLNFVDFKVMLNGKPIPTRTEVRAFLNGRDITARLRSAGLPPTVLFEPLNAAIRKLTPARRNRLAKDGLIVAADFNPPLRSVGSHGWFATWTMRVRFYWTQRFPAHSDVELVQTYRPVVGGSYITEDGDGSELVKPFCAGPKVLRQIKLHQRPYSVATSGNVVWWERNVDFILKTANNWRGPIRRFRLLIMSDSPEDIFTTCMPGLKRVGATRYELVRRNFHPRQDLKLLILQLNR